MTFEEIKALIQLINKSELSEFRLEEKDYKILIRTAKYHNGKQQSIVQAAPAPYAQPSPAPITLLQPAPVPTPVA
ncbi:MAG: acetyl-CoA carboxylase, biotin carboxyl carrier protein, partial [Saprospiraceae bacterium]|nr:acetyl-CoA carboxylase, biotin carboxyl carrier protein [Saprospiraceae bacterium]